MKAKALLFDLDGTLLNTLEDLADSFNYSLQQSGFPTHETESYKQFVGEGALKAIERALPEGEKNPEIIQKVLSVFNHHYFQNCFKKTKPYEGILPLLEKLKSEKIRLGIITNKSQHFAEQTVLYYFKNNFDLLIGEQKSFPKKPDPKSVFYALDYFQVSKDEVYFIGDSKTDMQTAQNAGIKSIGVLWGFRTKKELIDNQANVLIEQPEKILKYIL
ncbi:MAG: hypothetical protein A2Y41_05840 [Spirochaetes bacterium GWB1_36_13]|nr:MAG: hypothetical protein A2Y41_05840 [Spirochaetes bacterium GWB1_36_13]